MDEEKTKSIFDMTPEEHRAARENPDFVYAKLGDTWVSNKPHNDGGFVLDWGAKGIGFGQFTFIKQGDKTVCYTECMSKEFIKKAVLNFLDNEVTYEDK